MKFNIKSTENSKKSGKYSLPASEKARHPWKVAETLPQPVQMTDEVKTLLQFIAYPGDYAGRPDAIQIRDMARALLAKLDTSTAFAVAPSTGV